MRLFVQKKTLREFDILARLANSLFENAVLDEDDLCTFGHIHKIGCSYNAVDAGQEIFVFDGGRRLFLATLAEACRQTGWMLRKLSTGCK